MNPKLKSYLIHSSLFIVTFITTTLAGATWTYGKSIFFTDFTWDDFASGLPYSICFLGVLTCHEFGHYFTAIYYRVKTTLPYYIPLPPVGLLIGTLGALIRIKEPVPTNKQQFDIGIAGPLAGLVVAIGFLIYGFLTLPPPEYVFQFHPEYQKYGLDYASHVYDPTKMPEGTLDIIVGKNLLFVLLEKLFADPTRMPNPHEIMHYPYLFAGFLSLLVTALNLIPVGQLDGGHVLYGLVGYRWHKRIATIVFFALLFFTGLGPIGPNTSAPDLLFHIGITVFAIFMAMRSISDRRRDKLMYALIIFTAQYIAGWLFPQVHGDSGLFFFAIIIGFFVGVPHPPSAIEEPLNSTRKVLGWFALIVFILCLTPDPISFVLPPTATP